MRISTRCCVVAIEHALCVAKVVGRGRVHVNRGAEEGSEENGDAERSLRPRTDSPTRLTPRANDVCAGTND